MPDSARAAAAAFAMRHTLAGVLLGVAISGFAASSGASVEPKSVEAREAAVREHPLKEAYFGETHLHTSYSLDAYIGGTRLTPDDAYRFAKGEDVVVNGSKRKLERPLDFAAVSDHAENIGELYSAQVPGAPGYDHPDLVELRGLDKVEDRERWFMGQQKQARAAGGRGHPAFYAGPGTTRSAWLDVIVKAARDHYVPGRFTTLAGFEWSAAPGAANLHRNVLFRDLDVPEMPFSSIDSKDEERLWAWMTEQERQGRSLLAIPHNSNASKGAMFEAQDNQGRPLTADYARLRSRLEPLIEMMQVKGNSEVVQQFWAADEFAGFENAPSMQRFNERTFRRENFVRWGVTKGLDHAGRLGVNPYQYGFIGGTDSHNGTPADTAESSFGGSHGAADDTVQRRRTGEVPGWLLVRESNPGSVAGVWATRNTRAAIWDAMKARETFVTSGPRIKVRFFGGAGLAAKPANARALVQDGYRNGVPMGGVLGATATSPTFTVWAAKDPDGAHLDRIQIVKGWVDAEGEPQDRVFDVAWSGTRKPGGDGRLPEVGSTVDLATARYTNAIGAPELMGSWRDPGFDPKQHALYYVRVLEIPTPRWTTHDAVRNGLPVLEDVPATVQERAWSSPIWYTPSGK